MRRRALRRVRGYVAGSGTDRLARLLVTKIRHLSLGSFIFICDAAVVLASVFAFGDIESGIYAGAAIAVCSYTTDRMIHGFNKAVVFEVITPDGESCEKLSRAVMEKLDRGVIDFAVLVEKPNAAKYKYLTLPEADRE